MYNVTQHDQLSYFPIISNYNQIYHYYCLSAVHIIEDLT